MELPPGGSQASQFWAADPTLHSLCWRDRHPPSRGYGFVSYHVIPLEVGEGKQQPRLQVGSVHKKREFSSFQQMSISQKTESVISACQTHRTVITSQDPVYKVFFV